MTTVGLILTIVGLSIIKPAPPQEGVIPYRFNSGTSIYMAVEAEKDMMIISIDDSSVLDYYKDDKGKDLLQSGDEYGTPKWLNNSQIRYNENKKRMKFSIHSKKLPSKDATKLTVKGKIVVNCAKSTKVVTTEEIPIALKQPVVCGPIKATIYQLGENWNKKMEVSLKSNKKFDFVLEVSLITPDGKTLKGEHSGCMYSNEDDNSYIYGKSYSFDIKKLPARAKLKFKVFDGMETKEVPINVTTSIGL